MWGWSKIDDIPIWIRVIFGFLEITTITMFLTTWLNLNLTWKRKLLITVCVLSCVLTARIIFQNVFYVTGAGIISFYISLWFFAGARGLQVIISILASYMVLIIIEPVIHLLSLEFFSGLDYLYIWLISGLPNIIVFILLTYLLIKVRQKSEKTWHEKI